jgi:hypothetical protein
LTVALVSEKVFLTADERAERSKQIKRLLAEAQEHSREDAIQIGVLLRDAHDRIEEGGWGKFCSTAGMTRRKADMYRFIATSEVALLLRGIKFSVCLVLARFALRGKAEMATVLDLLRNEDVSLDTGRDNKPPRS